VIGWLYQFYISEKKDEVFDGLKKNKKITPENIPAATQLFTPHWIVRYLVENSLGRLWLLNRPQSKLVGQMDYYIKPEQAETDFLRINKPEEIKICDPACGSGHMLTYAFDLLYAIYEEEGYEPAEIPSMILTHNLYGIEIDERAGELAAFALTMKARARQRRFFTKGVKPNICVLENVRFDEDEIEEYMDFVGRDLFTTPLQTTLRQFEEADNFGSLIRPEITDVDGMLGILESKNVSGHLFLSLTHQKVLQALRQADYLSPKYHVVIANPPYMGASGMNPRLKAWVGDNYPDSKADFMTCFMERCFTLTLRLGFWGMINLPSWMFLSTFESFRSKLLTVNTFNSLLHLGRGIFGSDFGSVAFSIQNTSPARGRSAIYRRLFTKHVEVRTPKEIESIFLDASIGRYEIEQDKLVNIPGNPIAYWASENQRLAFSQHEALGSWAAVKQGLATADNNRFLRLWHEISNHKFGLNVSSTNDTKGSASKWFPYNKGGEYRRWYGNFEYVVNWENDGFEIRNFADEKGKVRSRAQNTEYYFQEGVTWTFVSSGSFGVRFAPKGSIFDVAGSSAFPGESYSKKLTAFLASKVTSGFLALINPTLNFQVGNIASLPIDKDILDRVSPNLPSDLISKTKLDWDSYETSWDFTNLPLLNPDYHQLTLKATYQKLRAHWREMTLEMQRLEQENNRIFIDAYGLQDELDEKVDLSQITLTCNPHYRYGNDKSEE
ncbi:MAG: BREX-1 system adenine-specific DNA-methyltransferase PglX, partial [Nitrospira sp.]|nr:BREX-1 system adenine-specific DNA-methyltransferase PglX [Nitrospira sp.]